MKRYLYLFLIIFIGLSSLIACTDQREKNNTQNGLTETINLLQTFHVFQQQETSLIAFRSEAEPEHYLLQGWSPPEKGYTWATGHRSRILFYRYDLKNDLDVGIICKAIPSPDNVPQQIEVLVNGTELGTIVIEADNFNDYDLTIPASLLRSGRNVLEFRFSYTTKPNELDRKIPDVRNLSVAFHKITFVSHHKHVHTHEATQLIDFRQAAHPELHLLSGWNSPEEGHTWATSEKSQVSFYAYDTKKKLKLEVDCHAIPSETGAEQVIKVHVNGEPIETFSVNAKDFEKYKLSIPAEYLRFGKNLLEFAFAYRSKPSQVFPNSIDNRKLAVAFREIIFRKNPPIDLMEGKGILQQTGSSLQITRTLPQEFELELHYESSKGAASGIQFLHDQHEPVEIAFSPKKKTYKKMVQLAQSGIYKIQLSTEGKPESYTVWNDLNAHIKPQQGSVEQPTENSQTQGFVKTAQPDILLYVVDTLRADHVGYYGYERNTTPNLDRFAQENAIFSNAYAADSWTKASAATIVSGLMPKNNKTMTKKDKLPEEIVTLAERLKESGYYTIAFTSNGNFGLTFGFSQGFDEFRRFVEPQPVTLSIMSDTLNESILPFLKDYTAKKDRKPLFMMIWTMDPHDPYTPDESVKDLFDIDQYTPIDTYDLKFLHKIQLGEIQPTPSQIDYIKTRYDQEIYFNDRSFGEVLDIMKSVGLYDKALMIFTSDHGEEFWDHGGVGHGRTLYNEQVRIPFVIKTEQIPQGSHAKLIQHIDIYPTILDILGLDAPYPLDGMSILRSPDSERTLFFEEDFDKNVLTASLNSEKKAIFNRQYHRPQVKEHVATFEAFDFDDTEEQQNLGLMTIDDGFRFDELFFYIEQESTLNLQRTEADIPPELDKHLQDLGYVR